MTYNKAFFNRHARFCSSIGKTASKIANNTYLVKMANGNVGAMLHRTVVVEFVEKKNQLMLHTGGHYSKTTKSRINSLVPGRIFQKDYVWYYEHPDGTIVEYEEGMVVPA